MDVCDLQDWFFSVNRFLRMVRFIKPVKKASLVLLRHHSTTSIIHISNNLLYVMLICYVKQSVCGYVLKQIADYYFLFTSSPKNKKSLFI